MRRWVMVLVLLVGVGGAANYLRPLPATEAAGTMPSSQVIPGTPPVLPWPSGGSGAIAIAGLGPIGKSDDQPALAAASITKVMTALVLLQDKPLQVGESGPTITLTDADVQLYLTDAAGKQSTVPVRAGETLSELQALEGMLIPSANNLAETLARWDAGSIDSFVSKMNTEARTLHLAQTTFADVSGASPGSVSTPSDLVTLGMYAMEHENVMAQIVAMAQVDLPVAGTVYNVDAALGKNGISGIKTGSGLASGANFLFAATAGIDGHTSIIYGCVMGLPTLADAFASAQALITAVTATLRVRQLIVRNQTVARYETAWGAESDLVSNVDVSVLEWPGMVLRIRIDANAIVVDEPIAADTVEGSAHVTLGDYNLDVALKTAGPLYPPGRLWRLTRLSA